MSSTNDKLINYGNLAAFHSNLLNDSSVSELATWSSSKISSEISGIDSSLAAKADVSYVDSSLALKQNLLSAGQNIAIDASNNISAEGYVFDGTKGSFAEQYFDDDNNVIATNTATGIGAHAEGYSNIASGDYGAHAEGYLTKATYTSEGGYNHGVGAHAEGWATEAKHDGAHAEGTLTLAAAQGAHAEGAGAQNELVQALGIASHAEGVKTIARNRGEHAEGFRNISHTTGSQIGDSSSDTMHSVGIGTNNLRRNAEEIMQNGDMYVFGIGNYDGIHIKNEQGAPAGLQTLQEVIANKANVYEVATIAEIEALFAAPEPEPTYPPLNQIWYTTSNGQEYGFEDYTSIWDVRTYQSIMPTSNVYSNGKGVITYPQDLIDMSNFGSIGQWDAENATATAVWLPYLTKTTVINGEGDPQVIYPFSNMLNNVDTLTDVYYPGTVAELTEAMYDTDNEEWKDCLISETSGNRIVSAIHCSDGDFTWQVPA